MRFEEGELGEVVLNALTSDPSENQDEETQSPAALPTGKVDQQGDLTTSGATQNLSERSVKGRAKSGLLHRTFSIGSKIHKVLVGTLALNIACTDDECTQVTVTVDSDPGLTGRMRKVHTDSVGQPIRLYLVNVQQGDPSVNEGGITLRSEAMDLKIEPRMAFKDLAALMGVDLQQFVQVLKKRLQAKGLLKGDFMPEASLGDLALLLNTSPEVLRDEMVGAAAAIQIAKLIPKFEKIQKQFDKAETEYYGGYGRTVIIDHPEGVATLYAHMRNTQVSAGQAVSQGQAIGLSGRTGFCSKPELHFEIRKNLVQE